MEIGKKINFEIVLVETVVREYKYNIMATSKEEALKFIKDGSVYNSGNVQSVEVVEKI